MYVVDSLLDFQVNIFGPACLFFWHKCPFCLLLVAVFLDFFTQFQPIDWLWCQICPFSAGRLDIFLVSVNSLVFLGQSSFPNPGLVVHLCILYYLVLVFHLFIPPVSSLSCHISFVIDFDGSVFWYYSSLGSFQLTLSRSYFPAIMPVVILPPLVQNDFKWMINFLYPFKLHCFLGGYPVSCWYSGMNLFPSTLSCLSFVVIKLMVTFFVWCRSYCRLL